jgi:phage terminase large subunit
VKGTGGFGLDFEYTNDPSAFVAALVNKELKKIYIFDEHYEGALTNDKIAEIIKKKSYAKEKIIADSSEPKSIDEIRGYGINRIRAAEKGPDSIINGIQYSSSMKL